MITGIVDSIDARRGFLFAVCRELPVHRRRVFVHQNELGAVIGDLQKGDWLSIADVTSTAKGPRATRAEFLRRPEVDGPIDALVTTKSVNFLHANTADGRSVYCPRHNFVDFDRGRSPQFDALFAGSRIRCGTLQESEPNWIGFDISLEAA